MRPIFQSKIIVTVIIYLLIISSTKVIISNSVSYLGNSIAT